MGPQMVQEGLDFTAALTSRWNTLLDSSLNRSDVAGHTKLQKVPNFINLALEFFWVTL